MTIAPDDAARLAARARQARLTKPAGALGRLEPLSEWASAVQGSCPPRPFANPALVILAGDHGVARTSGTSAYPPEVTAQMVRNFLVGGAAANVIAGQVGARLRVVDVAVDADPDYLDDIPGGRTVVEHRIRRSSGSIDREDALSGEECDRALALGRMLAHEEITAGADLLMPGDMGIGNTTAAAAVIGLLTGTEAELVTGRGTGIDDDAWQRKASVVAAAMSRTGTTDPHRVLTAAGGADLAAMTGFLLGAAERGVPVLLDGVVSLAAALAAAACDRQAAAWWAAGHRSTEPAATVALGELGLDPILDLDLRLGEGTGALLALPMVNAAILTLSGMATFGEAGVSDRDAVRDADQDTDPDDDGLDDA